MIVTQNKTKYINHSFKGAPQVLNEYGSLVKCLNTVLCDGFNEILLESLEVLSDNTLKINLPGTHGFILEQVISLSGALESEYNGDFRIIDKQALYVILGNPGGIVFPPSSNEDNTISIKTAALGFSNVYTSSSEKVMCFKNKSSKNPGVLKVIDELSSGYSTSWSKFARVVMGEEVDSSGEFLGGFKAPKHPNYPDSEKTGNGVPTSSGVHGFAKWWYAPGTDSYSRENVAPPSNSPRRWELIGDGNTFYFLINTEASNVVCNFGFGNIFTEGAENTLALQARDGFRNPSEILDHNKTNQYARESNHWGNLLSNSQGSFLSCDIFGGSNNVVRYYSTGLYFEDSLKDRPWNSSKIRGYNKYTGKLLSSKLFIKDDQGYSRGWHRGLNILYGSDHPGAGRLVGTPFLILEITDPFVSGAAMPLMFTLEDWEEV